MHNFARAYKFSCIFCVYTIFTFFHFHFHCSGNNKINIALPKMRFFFCEDSRGHTRVLKARFTAMITTYEALSTVYVSGFYRDRSLKSSRVESVDKSERNGATLNQRIKVALTKCEIDAVSTVPSCLRMCTSVTVTRYDTCVCVSV